MKAKIKILLDATLTLILLFLMGFPFWGNAPHEWVGATMIVLFGLHQILNGHWYKNLLKGKYTPVRVVGTVVNILLLAAMALLLYSGVIMSQYVFEFLRIDGGTAIARRLHLLTSYWGFLLMSVHIGLHWSMILGMAGIKKMNASRIPSLMGLAIAAYGVYAFIKRKFPTYLFLQTEFVFFDYNEPKILFYLDYLSIMGLCVFISHSLSVALRKKNQSKNLKRR